MHRCVTKQLCAATWNTTAQALQAASDSRLAASEVATLPTASEVPKSHSPRIVFTSLNTVQCAHCCKSNGKQVAAPPPVDMPRSSCTTRITKKRSGGKEEMADCLMGDLGSNGSTCQAHMARGACMLCDCLVCLAMAQLACCCRLSMHWQKRKYSAGRQVQGTQLCVALVNLPQSQAPGNRGAGFGKATAMQRQGKGRARVSGRRRTLPRVSNMPYAISVRSPGSCFSVTTPHAPSAAEMRSGSPLCHMYSSTDCGTVQSYSSTGCSTTVQ